MEEQISQSKNQSPEKPKRKYLKFIIGFLAIIILAAGGFFVWDKYFSQQAKLNRQNAENYQKYLDWQKNYEKAMREDTYGGKTPEETLKMFIEALKKEDIELASKYFMLETDTQDPDYLTRGKIFSALENYKTQNKLGGLISILSTLKPSRSNQSLDDGDYEFVSYDKDENVEITLLMVLNKQSNIWKIASL